jgi:hypothetical protein
LAGEDWVIFVHGLKGKRPGDPWLLSEIGLCDGGIERLVLIRVEEPQSYRDTERWIDLAHPLTKRQPRRRRKQ